MVIYSWFSHSKLWFSIVMLVYQRVRRTTMFDHGVQGTSSSQARREHAYHISITLYSAHIYIYIQLYIYMGASQNRRSGTSSGTTPVPYPRSIPPFHTSLRDPFHTSVPDLCSIPLIHTLLYIIIYNYYSYIYIYIWLCAIWFYSCTHIYERTYIHECIHARIRLLCPSPVIVLASLCLQHLQLLPTLLCDGRDVLGCCQLAV